MNKDKILLYFALKYEGNFNNIYNAICKHEQINFNDYFPCHLLHHDKLLLNF